MQCSKLMNSSYPEFFLPLSVLQWNILAEELPVCISVSNSTKNGIMKVNTFDGILHYGCMYPVYYWLLCMVSSIIFGSVIGLLLRKCTLSLISPLSGYPWEVEASLGCPSLTIHTMWQEEKLFKQVSPIHHSGGFSDLVFYVTTHCFENILFCSLRS